MTGSPAASCAGGEDVRGGAASLAGPGRARAARRHQLVDARARQRGRPGCGSPSGAPSTCCAAGSASRPSPRPPARPPIRRQLARIEVPTCQRRALRAPRRHARRSGRLVHRPGRLGGLRAGGPTALASGATWRSWRPQSRGFVSDFLTGAEQDYVAAQRRRRRARRGRELDLVGEGERAQGVAHRAAPRHPHASRSPSARP